MANPRAKTIHDDAYQLFVDALRTARTTAGVTQAILAHRLGTDQSYVSKYERSERRLDVIEFRDICHALGLDFLEFIAALERELKRRRLR
jgi:transcriptional regulator with XRE-family HTH domain